MKSTIVQKDIEAIVKSLGTSVHALEGKTVLISGSSGFLGSYFLVVLQHLNKVVLKKPCSVIALDNRITGILENVLGNITDKNFSIKNFDICSPISIRGPVDYIIHMAGIASPVFYMKYPLETIKTATIGTQNLLELAKQKKSKKLLFFSSSEIYGDPTPDAVPTKETYKGNVSCTGPRACYDESKRLGETFCSVYRNLYGVPAQIIRPFNVYGPGMKSDDRRVIPQFLSCAFEGKSLPVHGSGLHTRSYCYISDAITGFFKVLLSKKDGEVYNIGNHTSETNLVDLAKLMIELTKKPVTITKIPYPAEYPADEPSRRCPDITKAITELKFSPKVDLRTGLRRVLAWREELNTLSLYPEALPKKAQKKAVKRAVIRV